MTAKTAQRTPGPWFVSTDEATIVIRHGTGEATVAECYDHFQFRREGNAAFIVRACNSHDDLLAALQGMVDRFADDGPESRAACAAIARAEE